MKATAKCPKCGEVLTTDCEGCVSGGIDEHHPCAEENELNINWKVIDCSKEKAETLKRLGFQGELPEVLD